MAFSIYNYLNKYDKRYAEDEANRKQLDNFYSKNPQFHRTADIPNVDTRVRGLITPPTPSIPSSPSLRTSSPNLSIFSAVDKALGKSSYDYYKSSNTPSISATKTPSVLNNSSAPNEVFGQKSWNFYKANNPDTPDLIKPIGYALESPFRIPFVNRLTKAITGDSGLATNAPVNTYSTDTRNNFLNGTADVVGGLAGFGLKPRLMGANGVNLMTAGDAAGKFTADNIAAKLGNNMTSRVASSVGRGVVDGAVGNAAYDMAMNKEVKELPKSALIGAVGGAALMGGGKLASEGINKLKVPELNFGNLDGYVSKIDSEPQGKVLNIPNTNTLDDMVKAVVADNKPNINTPVKINPAEVQNEVVKSVENNIDNSSMLQKNFPVGSKVSFNANMGRGKGEVIGYKTDKWGNEWAEIDTGVKSQTGIGTIKDFKRIDDDIKLEGGKQPVATNKTTANSTTPPTENLNPSIGATDRKNLMVDIVTGDNKSKKTIKSAWDNFYTHAVDTNNPIKKVDENTYTLATNSKKVGGTVSHILHENLVDMKGNKIGEDSLKSIAKDIPANEEVDFIKYILQKHNIDRAREGKPVDPSFSSEQSVKAIKLLDKEHPEYKALGDRLTKFVNEFEKEWGKNSGLISDDLWNELQSTYKNYLPTNREFSELEQGISKGTNGRGFVDQTTPINKATGSDRNVINPIENIANLVNRTVRTARYNEVGQNLVEALNKNPQGLSKYAEIVKGQANSNAKNIVTVLQDGKPVNIKVNDMNLLEALQGLYKTIDLNGFENKVKTFNNVFKSLITTKNPFFAVKNISRDIPTAYINGSEANPFKFLVDLVKAGKDIVTNSDVAQKYKALGGESSNFFNPEKSHVTANELMNRKLITDGNLIMGSKPFNPIAKGIKKVGEKVEAFNNLTESMPRLAEFKRTLDKTGDVQKALYNSGEVTTNFSRGGDVTKKLDIGVPYLNASVQGLDKLARQFKNKPIATVLKGATSVTAPTLLLNYINKDNENYKQLDNRTKDNYFLFPKEDGTFIKLPKSREFGAIFGSLTERVLRQINGEGEAFKGFGNTLATNFSPANPIENNIVSPVFNLKSNKDFANRSIVPQSMILDNRSPYLQYDEKTTVVAKSIAAAAKKANVDLSPKQIDYIVKSYTGVIAQLAQPMLTESTLKGGKGIGNILDPIKTQFTADPAYSNQTTTDFYDNMDKAKRMATDKNITENIPSKTKTAEEDKAAIFTKAQKEISDITKEMSKAKADKNDAYAENLKAKIVKAMENANKEFKRK